MSYYFALLSFLFIFQPRNSCDTDLVCSSSHSLVKAASDTAETIMYITWNNIISFVQLFGNYAAYGSSLSPGNIIL